MNKTTLLIAVLSLGMLGGANNLFSEEKAAAANDKTTSTEESALFDFAADDGYTKWKSAAAEASVEVTKDGDTPVMVFKVKVDHLKDSKDNPKGKYLMGWPRIYIYMKPKLDTAKYKEFSFEYKAQSSLKEKESVPIYTYMSSGKARATFGFNVKTDGKWHLKKIKVADIIAKSGKPDSDWKKIFMVQFGLSERNYPDKAEVTVKLKDITLHQ